MGWVDIVEISIQTGREVLGIKKKLRDLPWLTGKEAEAKNLDLEVAEARKQCKKAGKYGEMAAEAKARL